MYSFLQPADAPVIEGLEEHEIVYAKHQHEYNPLRVIRSHGEDGRVLSRWAPTQEQRDAIANGADIYLEVCTFHRPLTPVRVAIGQHVSADYISAEFALPEKAV